MTYCVNIDWLAIFCLYDSRQSPNGEDVPSEWTPATRTADELGGVYDWQYTDEAYGTRQFSRLTKVTIPNEEGGRDDFAEVQSRPYAKIIHKDAVIVRFVNRTLYKSDFWDMCDMFLKQNRLQFKSITRVDICADFNQFATYDPRKLIEDFAAKRLRHIGRGVGALYFEHGVMYDKQTGIKDYGVKFNGLSFGTHSSDQRVYLYNKSFELLTQGDKPWIRDVWTRYGLNQEEVWRLEVSIKRKGCKFKCKQSGKVVTIDRESTGNCEELTKIYLSFVAKLFSFVKNRRHITNISREPRVQLFDSTFRYIRGVIRNKTGASRTEKMLIKALYQLGDKYRGLEPWKHAEEAQNFAYMLAGSCDLGAWMANKMEEWEKPHHK